MRCISEGIECSYDEPVYCPNCQEHIGYACVNCGDIYDGGALLNYGECSCIRKYNAQFVGVDVAQEKDETSTMVVEKCSFDGCNELVCEADKESPDRMHFCQQHHDQLAQYVKDNAIPKIIGFWVKANGGAKKLAKTF